MNIIIGHRTMLHLNTYVLYHLLSLINVLRAHRRSVSIKKSNMYSLSLFGDKRTLSKNVEKGDTYNPSALGTRLDIFQIIV